MAAMEAESDSLDRLFAEIDSSVKRATQIVQYVRVLRDYESLHCACVIG